MNMMISYQELVRTFLRPNLSIASSKFIANLLSTKKYNNILNQQNDAGAKEGANKRGNSSRLTQSFHFFMFEPIFSPVNALNQPI